MYNLFGLLGLPAPMQLLVLLVLAVLLFGRNLPEVARSWGQKFAEFRRGMRGIENEIRSIASDITSGVTNLRQNEKPTSQTDLYNLPNRADTPSDLDVPTAPKFEPPPE